MAEVRVGMSTSSSLEAETPQLGARWIVERAAAAERAELDLFSLGDNHLPPKAYYQNTPMLARAMAEFTSAPTGCLFLLPLWNPVLAAEQIGTLASLTDQRFVVQTGLGGRRAASAMGIDIPHMGRRLEASINTIRALLAGRPVSHDEVAVRDARVRLVPSPPVEWWIGGTAEAAVRRAAHLGDLWYANADLDQTRAAALLNIYRDECANSGVTPRAALRRDVIVLRNADRANELGDELLAAGYRGFGRDAVFYGSVDQVAEALAPYIEIGFTDLTCRCMSIPQADALETIENLAAVRDLLRAV